jgi:4-aminobutyrate aminotransferase-like enzyme
MSLACVSGPPLVAVEPAASNPSVTAAGGALDAVLASEVLQRVAWGGDRRRGVARLELGGDLAGAVVVVRGEGREVALELTLPRGGTAGELPERLAARLAARGLVVRELVVR